MGKRRGGKKAEEGSDAASSVGGASVYGAMDDDSEDKSTLDWHIDALYEKRTSTREAGLAGLLTLMERFENSADVEGQQHTLTTLFTNIIKRGGSTEQEMATRALGLLCVNLGCCTETHGIFQAHGDLLQKVCRAGKSTGSRVVGVDVLALLTFIACEDYRETLEVMQGLEAALRGEGKRKGAVPEVQAAAARGWALLLTTVPRDVVRRGDYFESHLAPLNLLLAEESVEVREAAGEAIAVLYDAYQGPLSEDGSPEDEVLDLPQKWSSELHSARERMVELIRNMGDSQRRSKKDRSAQKSAFKEIISILDGEAVTEVKLKLRHGDALYIDTLSGVMQLNAIRRFLAGGFQDHLQHNPLLHDIFEFQPQMEVGERMSNLEQRMFKSSNSMASRDRQRQRGSARARAAAHAHSLLGESW